jgi:hypothetical protein
MQSKVDEANQRKFMSEHPYRLTHRNYVHGDRYAIPHAPQTEALETEAFAPSPED